LEKIMKKQWTVLALGLAFCVQGRGQTVAIHGDNGVVLGPPPVVAVKPVTDMVGGREITDNYRWLEDQNSPETRAYIAAEMAYTESYFSQLQPLRDRMIKRLTEMTRVDSVSPPSEVHGRFFYSKRLAAENQGSLYYRQGLDGSEIKIVDAAAMSADGNTSVGIEDISPDGKTLAYSVRHGGADEGAIQFMDVDTKKPLSDTLPAARYDGFGFAGKVAYYGKIMPSGSGAIFLHTMGTSADRDLQIFPAADGKYKGETIGPLDLVGVGVSENERWLIVSISHGVPATREDILMQDLKKPGAVLEPLVFGVDSRFSLHMYGDKLFVSTDYNAPNGKVLAASFGDPSTKSWPMVVPEGKSPIDSVAITGGRMFVGRLVDVRRRSIRLKERRLGRWSIRRWGRGASCLGASGRRLGSIPSRRSRCRGRSTSTTSRRARALCGIGRTCRSMRTSMR
jgi:prolyl oligopeptidase